MDKSGNEILPLEFENIQVEKPDFFIVIKEGLAGALNEKGDALFPIAYQEIVADWTGNQILAKDLYKPVIIQAEEVPQSGKRKKRELDRSLLFFSTYFFSDFPEPESLESLSELAIDSLMEVSDLIFSIR